MFLATAIGIIVILSVVLAAWSLKGELSKTQEEKDIKKELQKGKVLFYAPTSDKESNGAKESEEPKG